MAVANFERVLLQHNDIWHLDESTLYMLLVDDNLAVHLEDTVLQVILAWLQVRGRQPALWCPQDRSSLFFFFLAKVCHARAGDNV